MVSYTGYLSQAGSFHLTDLPIYRALVLAPCSLLFQCPNQAEAVVRGRMAGKVDPGQSISDNCILFLHGQTLKETSRENDKGLGSL